MRESHDGFAKAVAELDAAAARAEQGLADLRAATDEAADALADRIEKARALTARLDRQLTQAPAARPEPVRDARGPREDLDLGVDAERVAHRLGALLSAAREPRPRPEPDRSVRREAPRQRPSFEDDIFADERAPRRAGARR